MHNAETANQVNWYLISGEGDCGEGDCGEGDCGEGDCGEGDCGEGEWIPAEIPTVDQYHRLKNIAQTLSALVHTHY